MKKRVGVQLDIKYYEKRSISKIWSHLEMFIHLKVAVPYTYKTETIWL